MPNLPLSPEPNEQAPAIRARSKESRILHTEKSRAYILRHGTRFERDFTRNRIPNDCLDANSIKGLGVFMCHTTVISPLGPSFHLTDRKRCLVGSAALPEETLEHTPHFEVQKLTSNYAHAFPDPLQSGDFHLHHGAYKAVYSDRSIR